ncbi:hypothetical protein B2J93_5212 [Marssonina coronariae]|uniref:Uncharacterized protein n=1 Tax=Diplocarpon coronariae TaxID=2795749 RepID=A0A218Z2Y4_9HELO|nr:hypothetical protein B2J93_5212 [Marssonina coronariae]
MTPSLGMILDRRLSGGAPLGAPRDIVIRHLVQSHRRVAIDAAEAIALAWLPAVVMDRLVSSRHGRRRTACQIRRIARGRNTTTTITTAQTHRMQTEDETSRPPPSPTRRVRRGVGAIRATTSPNTTRRFACFLGEFAARMCFWAWLRCIETTTTTTSLPALDRCSRDKHPRR